MNNSNFYCYKFPFHAAVVSELPFGRALCSGSLISRRAILTAASCVAGATSVYFHLGARDMNIEERYHARFEVDGSNIRLHPRYARQHRVLVNDVAIIRLPNPIAFFPTGVNVVALPLEADLDDDFSNEEVIVMG